jgi:hypothetical protein
MLAPSKQIQKITIKLDISRIYLDFQVVPYKDFGPFGVKIGIKEGNFKIQ